MTRRNVRLVVTGIAALAVLWPAVARPAVAQAPSEAMTAGLDALAEGRLKQARKSFRGSEAAAEARLGNLLLKLVEAYRGHGDQNSILAGRRYFQSVGGIWGEIQSHRLTPHIHALLPELRARLGSEAGAAAELRVLLCNLRMLSNDRSTDGDPLDAKGAVELPQRLLSPVAQYTAEARRARVEGVIITQTVIDSEGCVVSGNVRKGLSHGLDDSVRKALLWWVFEPARLEGAPVSVYYNFTTTFALQ